MQAVIYPGGAGKGVVIGVQTSISSRDPSLGSPKNTQIFSQRVPNESDGAPWIPRISRKITWMSKELFQVLHELCCCWDWRWVQGYFIFRSPKLMSLWQCIYGVLCSFSWRVHQLLHLVRINSDSFRKWEQRRLLATAKPFHALAKLWDFCFFSAWKCIQK